MSAPQWSGNITAVKNGSVANKRRDTRIPGNVHSPYRLTLDGNTDIAAVSDADGIAVAASISDVDDTAVANAVPVVDVIAVEAAVSDVLI
jgi:hypothetical protein